MLKEVGKGKRDLPCFSTDKVGAANQRLASMRNLSDQLAVEPYCNFPSVSSFKVASQWLIDRKDIFHASFAAVDLSYASFPQIPGTLSHLQR